MKPIVIYTKSWCPYCQSAKELLRRKGWTFTEVDVTMDRDAELEMISRADGRKSVPQIFIGDTHVGGCDDLYALDQDGKLDALVAA